MHILINDHQTGCTALFSFTIPLAVRIMRTILNSMIRAKQNIAKLCIGRIVCQTLLLGSSVIHTLISVNMKMMSKRMRMMVEARIYMRQRVRF